MIVKCVSNKGEFLSSYEYEFEKNKKKIGRFGSSADTQYNEVKVGREYLVMGIIVFRTYQGFLLDDDGFISVLPCQLFEILDNKIDHKWYFRMVDKEEEIYPYIQSIFGYYELCLDKNSYYNLIVEQEETSMQIYFRRKIELEKTLSE